MVVVDAADGAPESVGLAQITKGRERSLEHRISGEG